MSEILRMGDPRLLRVAEPVTSFGPSLANLITHMRVIMREHQGIGLAAPQIGVNLRVVVFGMVSSPRYPDAPPIPDTVLVNPVIQPLSADEEEGWEGCLSLPGLRGWVPRWKHIRYAALDEQGIPFERRVEGFHARVVQHECDHLNGYLYPMRIRDFTRFGFTDVLFSGGQVAPDE